MSKFGKELIESMQQAATHAKGGKARGILLEEADERSAKMAFERTRDEEFFPLELADRLLKRENPVRVWRGRRGLTLAQLGARAGLSRGYLSDIENGKRSGTVATLRAIAKALDVDVDDLVPPVRGRRTA